MAKSQIPASSVKALLKQLSSRAAAREVDLAALRRARVLPTDLGFGPDLCIRAGKQYFLIHQLTAPRIPDRIAKAARRIKDRENVSIIAFSPLSETVDSRVYASKVIEHCKKRQIGLLLETTDGSFVVLPPRYKRPRTKQCDQEHGHVPSWVIERLKQCKGFSPHLAKCTDRFAASYATATKKDAPSSSREAHILYTFIDEVFDGDPRLFFPVHRLQALQAFEQSRANIKKRDHFFHTFNDLFLGLLILGELFGDRKRTARPDRFLEDPKGRSKLKFWESLWIITCLFHDPGYLAESLWSSFYFTLGLEHSSEDDPSLPESMLLAIQRAWNSEFTAPRKDLLDLFRRISDQWVPDSVGSDVATQFDSALESAYLDQGRPSHSIISGLSLIQLCKTDTAHKHKYYDKVKALVAVEIGALSMIFHDQQCRDKLEDCGLAPIPFEHLPYAATLMFVDALQDDRRDISTATFPKVGVLTSLVIEPQKELVRATVCLPSERIRNWPFMIAELENVTRWINRRSDIKFIVDYSTESGLTLRL